MSTFKISEDIRQELEKLKGYMRKQEYTEGTITGYCTYLSRFLRLAGLPKEGELQEVIQGFLETERDSHLLTLKDCSAALRLFYKMATNCSMKSPPPHDLVPAIEAVLQHFREYSLDIKHLRNGTADSEISHVRRFLEYVFDRNPQGFSNRLTAEDIRDYVIEQLDELSDSTKGRYITSIRNFFHFQEFYGQSVNQSIFRLPLSPAVWKKSAFPSTVDMDVFDTLYMIPDKNTDTGKRNSCIILFFTELALRCSEVAALTLDNFNWRTGCVTVRSTKNGSDRVLPLSAKLGASLVEYLMNARPQSSCRTLFVRFSHLRGEPMGCMQIRGVVRRNSVKAGLKDSACGTHILRRTVATKLYNSGNSLKLTADILGHESLDSTTHYTKTDVAGLLSTASPWPGGERNDG